VSQTGLQADLEKVRVMLSLLPPTSVKEIHGFLGCVGYYRRFIEGYAKRAIPLMELLKKDTEFIWIDQRHRAFEDSVGQGIGPIRSRLGEGVPCYH